MKKILLTSCCIAALMGIVTAQATQKVAFTAPVIKKNVEPKTEVVQFTPPKIVKNKEVKKRKTYAVKRKSTRTVKDKVQFTAPVILPGNTVGNKG